MLTPLREKRTAAVIAVVGVSCLLVGAFFGGNLLTFVTGEYGGVGPGFMQQIGMKVDTTAMINTAHPENYMSGMARVLAPLTSFIWQATGKMWVEADGSYTIFWSRHAGVLTNDGKDWLEDQISDSPSAATIAKWIALTRNSHAPAAGDHRLWNEIDTAGGLDKVEGTYASTGVGTWTVIKQFTADTDYVAVQATGLHWTTTGMENGTMLCADTFTPVTLANGDKLTITWSLSIA
jgi:hypothetical protein